MTFPNISFCWHFFDITDLINKGVVFRKEVLNESTIRLFIIFFLFATHFVDYYCPLFETLSDLSENTDELKRNTNF